MAAVVITTRVFPFDPVHPLRIPDPVEQQVSTFDLSDALEFWEQRNVVEERLRVLCLGDSGQRFTAKLYDASGTLMVNWLARGNTIYCLTGRLAW